MNSPHGSRKEIEANLEAFLDHLLESDEEARIEQALSNPRHADLAKRVQAQRAIDERLKRSFRPPSKPPTPIDDLIAETELVPATISRYVPAIRRRRQWLILIATLVATLVLFIANWPKLLPKKPTPFFEPRSLTSIYRESVDQGFRPYYFCDEPERFALTFAKRQDQPLKLLELPSDRRMIGLAYLGGMSRDTTAVLCYANDVPVMVFVDRLEVDQPALFQRTTRENAPIDATTRPQLFVHRNELEGLVLYEVSPLRQPYFTDYLVKPTEP